MESRLNNKIYILGSVASGKTTMAKALSGLLDMPWYELDNVVYLRLPAGDKKRTPEERDLVFNNIIDSEKWIIEGVFRPCFNDGFEKSDTIILLDTPSLIRKYRITKRWIAQRLRLEKANYIPTINMLQMMYKWSNDFENSKDELMQALEPYTEKLMILKDNKDILSITKNIKYNMTNNR